MATTTMEEFIYQTLARDSLDCTKFVTGLLDKYGKDNDGNMLPHVELQLNIGDNYCIELVNTSERYEEPDAQEILQALPSFKQRTKQLLVEGMLKLPGVDSWYRPYMKDCIYDHVVSHYMLHEKYKQEKLTAGIEDEQLQKELNWWARSPRIILSASPTTINKNLSYNKTRTDFHSCKIQFTTLNKEAWEAADDEIRLHINGEYRRELINSGVNIIENSSASTHNTAEIEEEKKSITRPKSKMKQDKSPAGKVEELLDSKKRKADSLLDISADATVRKSNTKKTKVAATSSGKEKEETTTTTIAAAKKNQNQLPHLSEIIDLRNKCNKEIKVVVHMNSNRNAALGAKLVADTQGLCLISISTDGLLARSITASHKSNKSHISRAVLKKVNDQVVKTLKEYQKCMTVIKQAKKSKKFTLTLAVEPTKEESAVDDAGEPKLNANTEKTKSNRTAVNNNNNIKTSNEIVNDNVAEPAKTNANENHNGDTQHIGRINVTEESASHSEANDTAKAPDVDMDNMSDQYANAPENALFEGEDERVSSKYSASEKKVDDTGLLEQGSKIKDDASSSTSEADHVGTTKTAEHTPVDKSSVDANVGKDDKTDQVVNSKRSSDEDSSSSSSSSSSVTSHSSDTDSGDSIDDGGKTKFKANDTSSAVHTEDNNSTTCASMHGSNVETDETVGTTNATEQPNSDANVQAGFEEPGTNGDIDTSDNNGNSARVKSSKDTEPSDHDDKSKVAVDEGEDTNGNAAASSDSSTSESSSTSSSSMVSTSSSEYSSSASTPKPKTSSAKKSAASTPMAKKATTSLSQNSNSAAPLSQQSSVSASAKRRGSVVTPARRGRQPLLSSTKKIIIDPKSQI